MAALSDAEALIAQLELLPHPEGGFYRVTYVSPLQLNHDLPADSTWKIRPRSACTAIHFLLPSGHVSHLHRMKSYCCGPRVVSWS